MLESCKICYFCVSHGDGLFGCHRHAPKPGDGMAIWPLINPDRHWCGEFAPEDDGTDDPQELEGKFK